MHEHALAPATDTAPIDARLFRDTLGHYASGITVISGLEADEPVGFTCQSFYSVSIDPPLVSFSVMLTSTTYPRIKQSGRFAVNVLAHDQLHVSNQFARKGTDKWAGIEWSPAASGNPVIQDTLMWVDCELWNEAADRLIKCQEKGKLTGRKIQVTGALANSHWKKKVGSFEVPMNTKYCKVRSFELLGSLKTDDSLMDGSTEIDDTTLEPEVSEPLYVNESAVEAQKPAAKGRK